VINIADDMRFYETFYGIDYDDWLTNFGSFSNTTKILVKDYISDACTTTETSIATDGVIHKFLYQHHTKKKYFVEGVIDGQITVVSSGATSTLTSYRVTLSKVNEDTTETELFTTGWVVVNDTLAWDAVNSVGSEIVYAFWIDAWQYETLTDKDRFYVKVEVDGDTNCRLYHSNSATWEDLRVNIPFRL